MSERRGRPSKEPTWQQDGVKLFMDADEKNPRLVNKDGKVKKILKDVSKRVAAAAEHLGVAAAALPDGLRELLAPDDDRSCSGSRSPSPGLAAATQPTQAVDEDETMTDAGEDDGASGASPSHERPASDAAAVEAPAAAAEAPAAEAPAAAAAPRRSSSREQRATEHFNPTDHLTSG